MYEFKNTSDVSYFNGPNETITVTTEAVTLDEILQAFERFLRGCGFQFDGTVDVVPYDESFVQMVEVGAEGSDYRFDPAPGANGPAGS